MSAILVTGGLGTVGKVLVGTLRRRGHTVTVSGPDHHHVDDYARCDVGSFMQRQRLFQSAAFRYLYHLATEFGRWNGEDQYGEVCVPRAVGTKHPNRLHDQHA